MAFEFERLVGAAGDLRELEYISALHQTDPEVRRDGSIRACDISLFLSSRYGIIVSEEKVADTILKGLGGSDDSDEVIDLMEVVALMFIPILLKARQEHISKVPLPDPKMIKTPPGMLEYVLKMILADTTGDSSPKPLTKETLAQIFGAYGETDIARNPLLLEEIINATGICTNDPNPMLNVNAFAGGLTNDVLLYDIRNETRLTTHYQDVFLDEEVARIEAEAEEPDDSEEHHHLDMSLRSNHNEHMAFQMAKDFAHATGSQQPVSPSQFLSTEFRRSKEMSAPPPRAVVDPEQQAAAAAAATTDEETYSSPQQEVQDRLDAAKHVDRVFTAPSIDVTAGTMRSKALTVFLWSTVLISYFGHVFYLERTSGFAVCQNGPNAYEFSLNAPWVDNADAIACEFGYSVLIWLILFTLLMVIGVALVGLGSMGNYVGAEWWKPCVGAGVILLYILLSFFLQARDNKEELYLGLVALALGATTIGFHLVHLMEIQLPHICEYRTLPEMIKNVFTSSNVFSESAIKEACSRKMAAMARNALEIVQVKEQEKTALGSHFGQALDEYAKSGKRYAKVGGFVWTWRRFISRRAFAKDGVFISTRLIASNIAQFFVTLYILLAGYRLILTVGEAYDSGAAEEYFMSIIGIAIDAAVNETLVQGLTVETADILGGFLQNATTTGQLTCNGALNLTTGSADTDSLLCQFLNSTEGMQAQEQLDMFNASGLDTQELTNQARTALEAAVNSTVQNLFPSQRFMVVVPCIVGVAVAVLAALYITLGYMPSVTSTILSLRSGGIPTLRDAGFNVYRVAPDQVALLTGSLFWGCLLGSVLVGGVFALLVFFFVWQVTAFFAQRVVAIILGLVIVVSIRIIGLSLCRCHFYTAFYRQKPAQANYSLLGLEWATFALSFGFVLTRMIKLLLIAATFVGRIDRPFLASGVGKLLCLDLDNYPMVHTKDILIHEAHRHPWIELLGTMYMMKLRYADDFGKTAGSCWRLLFVYALFPWLHRYRISARPEIFAEANNEMSRRSSSNSNSYRPLPLNYVSLRKIPQIQEGDNEDDDDDDMQTGSVAPLVVVASATPVEPGTAVDARLPVVEANDDMAAAAAAVSAAQQEEIMRQQRATIDKLETEVADLRTELQSEVARLREELLQATFDAHHDDGKINDDE